MSRDVAGMVMVLGLLYLNLASRPIWHTDVWGHLSYGRVIWENRSIPKTEPLLPLAKGMPFVDTAWLSQILGYAIVTSSRLQMAGLQGLFAIGVTWCGALLMWSTYRQTHNGFCALLTLFFFLLIGGGPLMVLRPQLAGLVCFILILTRLVPHRARRSDWFVVPMTFVLWANLHASFLVGLGLLASVSLGRWFDVLLRTGAVRKAFFDRRVQRTFWLTLLGSTSVLVNPYTYRIYLEVAQFSACQNLRDLTEWQPLNIREAQGGIFAAVTLILVGLYRFTPRRVPSWELLALGGLGFETLWSARMMIWWAPIAALLVAQHAFAVWRKVQGAPLAPKPRRRSSKWCFVSTALLFVCFLLSPLGTAVITGRQAEIRRSVSLGTPVFAAEYLKLHLPPGPVFNTYEWGDYLQWAGPNVRPVFVNSHAHLVPSEVWRAYMQVSELQNGWESTLDRYGINTVVIDRANRESLVQALMRDDRWQFPPVESEGQVIFLRKQPLNIALPDSSR